MGWGGVVSNTFSTFTFLDTLMKSNLQSVNCWEFTVLLKDVSTGEMSVPQTAAINSKLPRSKMFSDLP